MIVFSAIVPHSPLLIPAIGKDKTPQLKKTLDAYTELEHALYVSQPDAILLLSPHATLYPDAFSGNMADHFFGGLKEFGDHGTRVEVPVDFLTLDRIHRGLREANVPFTLTSQPELDYGCTIPLLLLTPHLPNCPLIPLAPSLLDANAHRAFGQALKHILANENSRIAVIASADLSHHVTSSAERSDTQEGAWFDHTIREKIAARDVHGMLTMDQASLEKAGQCGYRPILVLMSLLEEMNVTPRELSYEAPFGVGYLCEQFVLA